MKIVAVTACVVGMAHCKMARKALKKEAKLREIEFHCEAQTGEGIEHELDQADINAADLVIFAVDLAVRQKDRFKGKLIYETSPSTVLKDTGKAFDEALKLLEK